MFQINTFSKDSNHLADHQVMLLNEWHMAQVSQPQIFNTSILLIPQSC